MLGSVQITHMWLGVTSDAVVLRDASAFVGIDWGYRYRPDSHLVLRWTSSTIDGPWTELFCCSAAVHASRAEQRSPPLVHHPRRKRSPGSEGSAANRRWVHPRWCSARLAALPGDILRLEESFIRMCYVLVWSARSLRHVGRSLDCLQVVSCSDYQRTTWTSC